MVLNKHLMDDLNTIDLVVHWTDASGDDLDEDYHSCICIHWGRGIIDNCYILFSLRKDSMLLGQQLFCCYYTRLSASN